jgi:hypothetical protein
MKGTYLTLLLVLVNLLQQSNSKIKMRKTRMGPKNVSESAKEASRDSS